MPPDQLYKNGYLADINDKNSIFSREKVNLTETELVDRKDP